MSQDKTYVIPAALFCPNCGHCMTFEEVPEKAPEVTPGVTLTWIVTSTADAKIIH
jgi:uncharacterized Zn finger protein (UPF0148 family)